jgi:hypothetical protein
MSKAHTSKASYTRRPTADELALARLVRNLSMESTTLEMTQKVFDLDTKDDAVLYKQIPFTPAANTKEALERINNDAAKFLEIINAGLQEHAREQARTDTSIPWQAKDDEGNLIPWTGTPISEDKSKQLAANVLNMAKMLFGYTKEMSRDEKRVSKDKAQDMLLANPAVVDALKAS